MNERLRPRPLAAGTHLARISAILDLGTHTDQVGKAQRKLLLTFTVFADDGSTHRISRQFSHSLDVRSGLSKFLTPWLGTTWQTTPPGSKSPSLKVSTIAEGACLIVLQASQTPNPRTGQPYLNLISASPLLTGMTAPNLKWPCAIFTLKAPNRPTFKSLPDWIKTKIRQSHEWQTLTRQTTPA